MDAIEVRSPDDAPIVRNGDFEHGSDHWLYTDGNLAMWRSENFPLMQLSEAGSFGVLALAALLAYSTTRLLRSGLEGDMFAVAAAASIGGF